MPEFDELNDVITGLMKNIDDVRGKGEEEAKIRTKLGFAYAISGEIEKAEKEYSKAFEIYRKLRNDSGRATCYGNLGVIYGMREDFEKALEYYNKALELHEKLGLRKEAAQDYINMSLVNKSINNLEEAEKRLKSALDIILEVEDKEKLASVYSLLGTLKFDMEKFDKSAIYFNKAEDIYDEIEDNEDYALGAINLASALQAQTKLEEAEKSYIKAFNMLKKLNSAEFSKAALGLFEIYIIYAISDYNHNKNYKEKMKQAYDFLKDVGTQEALEGIIKNFNGLLKVNPGFVEVAVKESIYLGDGALETLRPLEIAAQKIEKGETSLEDVNMEYRDVVGSILERIKHSSPLSSQKTG